VCNLADRDNLARAARDPPLALYLEMKK